MKTINTPEHLDVLSKIIGYKIIGHEFGIGYAVLELDDGRFLHIDVEVEGTTIREHNPGKTDLRITIADSNELASRY